MDDPLVIVLVVIAVIVIAAGIYWMTRGKARRLEHQRERTAEHRKNAQGAAADFHRGTVTDVRSTDTRSECSGSFDARSMLGQPPVGSSTVMAA
jgi:cytoskeletal protein RodZ